MDNLDDKAIDFIQGVALSAAQQMLGESLDVLFYDLNSAIPHFRSKLRVISIFLSKYTRCSSIFSAVNRDEKC